jgi:hypothetical protein
LLHHHQWVARVGGHDGSAEFDSLAAASGSGEGGDAVQPSAPGGHPRCLNACFLRLLDGGLHIYDLVSTHS